jgi:hypothetical protein
MYSKTGIHIKKRNEDPWLLASTASQVMTLGYNGHSWNVPTEAIR